MTDLVHIIGETTDYDKKQQLEVNKPKSWCKMWPRHCAKSNRQEAACFNSLHSMSPTPFFGGHGGNPVAAGVRFSRPSLACLPSFADGGLVFLWVGDSHGSNLPLSL